MGIHSKMTQGIAASVLVSLMIAAVAFLILQGMSVELGQSRMYDDVITKANALNVLLVSLRQGANPSQMEQLINVQASLDDLLGNIHSKDALEHALIRQIQRDNERLGFLFDPLASGIADGLVLEEAHKEMIESQLWMKVRQISDESQRLRGMSRARVLAAQAKAVIMVIALWVTLIVSNTVIFIFSGRKIVQSEESLRESEARYRMLFDNAWDGMALTDAHTGLLVDCNQALCRMVRREKEAMVGRPKSILHLAVYRSDGKIAKGQAHMQQPSGLASENHLIAKTGGIIPVEVVDTQIRMRGKTYFLAVFRDITQRRQAEAALKESELRFRLALEHIPDVIVIYGPDRRIRYINSATCEITGRAKNDFLGKRDEEVWPPEVYGGYLSTLQEAMETGTARSVEVKLTFEDTGDRFLSITCVPVLDDAGKAVECLGITRDLTEVKRSEEELKRHRNNLQELIDEKTLELRKALDLMTGRELRMAELKKNVATLEKRLGSVHTKPGRETGFGDS